MEQNVHVLDTGILGRMAAYAERTVTWAEMLASTERWEANLALRW